MSATQDHWSDWAMPLWVILISLACGAGFLWLLVTAIRFTAPFLA